MEDAPYSIRRAMYRNHADDDIVNVCEDFYVTNLYQSDFTNGTYIIREPGLYRLREDIVMAPSTEYMLPARDSEQYPLTQGYWLGFVAAIAVASDNVYLDLNAKSISMSPEFLMRQRFFSIIQLGERPFDAAAGPPQFKSIETSPKWASNVVITDGTLGMTSHTGVHGWSNNNIWIRNVNIRDFETAGIQINGGTNIHIYKTDIGPNLGHPESSGRVLGLATLSQATLLLRIVEGEALEEDVAFTNLRDSVERYIEKTLAGEEVEESEQIFVNEAGLPDGSSLHGIVLHASKPAIHDFASCAEFDASDESSFFGPVRLKRVTVKQLKLGTDEVVSMKDSTGTPIMGPAGDVLQVFRFGGDTGTYDGNVLSDAQLALGRLRLEHVGENEDDIFALFGALNIPAAFIDWTQGTTTWDDMMTAVGVTFVCSKDAMTHHNKGIMGLRIEYYNDVVLSSVKVEEAENVGTASLVSHCTGDDDTYTGNDVRGVTMSYVSGLHMRNVKIDGMVSTGGLAFGVEERTDVDWLAPRESVTIASISGHMGSTDYDLGLLGMLNSDVAS